MPVLDAPEVEVPLLDAPELDVPELDVPELDALEPDVPVLDALELDPASVVDVHTPPVHTPPVHAVPSASVVWPHAPLDGSHAAEWHWSTGTHATGLLPVHIPTWQE